MAEVEPYQAGIASDEKRLGSYYFYIDVEETVDSVLLTAAMAEIEALNCQVRVLGSYPCYTYPSLKTT